MVPVGKIRKAKTLNINSVQKCCQMHVLVIDRADRTFGHITDAVRQRCSSVQTSGALVPRISGPHQAGPSWE